MITHRRNQVMVRTKFCLSRRAKTEKCTRMRAARVNRCPKERNFESKKDQETVFRAVLLYCHQKWLLDHEKNEKIRISIGLNVARMCTNYFNFNKGTGSILLQSNFLEPSCLPLIWFSDIFWKNAAVISRMKIIQQNMQKAIKEQELVFRLVTNEKQFADVMEGH